MYCDVFQSLVQVIWFQCRYRQVEIQNSWFLSNIKTFLTRVKSASVGDVSLYDVAHNSDVAHYSDVYLSSEVTRFLYDSIVTCIPVVSVQ